MKLAVVDIERKRISFRKSFLRTILKLFPWEIAHVGVIFPTPLYFSQNADIRFATVLGIILFAVYSLSILIDSGRQAVYDKLLRTRVIIKS